MSADKMPSPGWKYYFSIKPQIQEAPVGEIPGGFRVDLRYLGGTIVTDEAKYERDWLARRNLTWQEPPASPTEAPKTTPLTQLTQVRRLDVDDLKRRRNKAELEWFGIDGAIVSGGDWATVRRDGVAMFDGRITIRSADGFLIDSVMSGVVDLRDRRAQGLDDASKVYNKWLIGQLDMLTVPVVLALHFEAADAGAAWAQSRFKNASAQFWKYERLVRGQFVAVGTLELSKSIYSPITAVTLDVYEMEGTVAGGGGG